ncbi:hypothetical protein N7519_008387 [Penicillium mononematosum]|uniref:uncharacterized protein n=1 Tax=Penicillium mononematosum TaxID=268346 RepID=UPI002547574A|nr:uncharacterized protein N7519_008387 [Penicillium mononematosum]KAJ6177926.1 hypothetical protein N7519_008387 [Penicillium mononematosum]
MTDADSASTRACWRDKLVFLVNANEWDFFNQFHFTAIPGADSNNLSGGNAMTGYEDAGYKNGYKSPGMYEIEKDSNADKYGKRVRYPSFFNISDIPVCEGLARTKGEIMANHHATSPFWPCDAPEGLNHVNNRWITANGKTPVCDTFTVDDPGYGDTLSATLYGRFDGENTSEATVKAKCKITFSWPKWWGDMCYGADGMYDGESKPFPDADGNPMCCKQDDNLTDMVTNPYVVRGACKPH